MQWREAAQKVYRESGLSGAPPASLSTATGNGARVFYWVQDSARRLAHMREDWLFRRGTATLATTTAAQLTAAAFDNDVNTDFGKWRPPTREYRPTCYTVSLGVSSEGRLSWLPYERFRAHYLFGSQSTGTPVHWTVGPDGALHIGPAPSEAVRLQFDYIKNYVDLADDNDATEIPLIPAIGHDAVVWLALLEYGGFAAASDAWQRAQTNYVSMLRTLASHSLEPRQFGAKALA